MGFRDRVRRSFRLAEKAESKYSVVERVPQIWKVIKSLWTNWAAWFAAVTGAVTTIVNWIPSVTFPGLPPWAWQVAGLIVFFVSIFVLLLMQNRKNRELQSVLSRATTIGKDEHGYMSVVPLVQQPETPPPAEEPPPLSRAEREAVRDMRDLWKDCASLASDKMRYLALNVLGTIDGGINWVERLLRPDIDGLGNATNSMDEMFKGSHITLQDARQKFDAFFAAYATTACDLHYIDRDHLPLTKPPCTEWYKRWEIANAAFMKGLKSLHNQPEYEHELKLVVTDNGAREFLDRRQFCPAEPKAEKEQYQRIADTLTEKYSDGVVRILNDGYANAEDLIDAPIYDDREWVADMLKTMKELGCTKAEIERVNILGMYEQEGETENAEVDRLKSIFNERLVRVRDIADTYQRMAHSVIV